MNSNKEVGHQLLIYTILLSSQSNSSWAEHLNQIAKLGGTEKVYEENSFNGLNNRFDTIANGINPEFGLKTST